MTATIAGYEVNFRKHIGRGAIGNVYQAKNKNGIIIAAKEVDLTRSERAAIREIDSARKHSKLKHDNIVKIFHILNAEDDNWIFMEYLEEGDLNNFAHNHFEQFCQTKFDLMTQMCKELSFLHDLKICHRDIKPENILVKCTDDIKCVTVKLTDFGISKFPNPKDLTSAMHTKVGTQLYMAPEFFIVKEDGKPEYHKSVDIFALGLTFLAMIQAQKGNNLRPIAEGCKKFESFQAIGIVMFNRHENGQSELVVLKESESGPDEIRVVEKLIRQATLFNPKHEKMLQKS